MLLPIVSPNALLADTSYSEELLTLTRLALKFRNGKGYSTAPFYTQDGLLLLILCFDFRVHEGDI